MTIRWLNDYSEQFLSKDYLLPGQTVQERLKIIGDYAEAILKRDAKTEEHKQYLNGYSEKLQQYIANGWISLSTPIWTNFGTTRGLPISCFNSHFPDTIEGILNTNAEIGTMTKMGGGTSGYFGEVRGRGSAITGNGTSNGTFPFLELTQATTSVISQGSTRRGYFAAYNDIFHPDIEEWLNIRGEGNPVQQITWGVCVPTWWLEEMKGGDADKRKVWAKVIQKRFETGLPYIFFTDNANNGPSVPEVYRGKNLIKSSNLCTEIFLPSNEDSSFVCDLSSLVDLYFEEWKDTDCVEVVTFLLDAVMTSFIEEASKIMFMERTVKFAQEHRALGIGRMGYHSLLQSKMIPFESPMAKGLNIKIFKDLREKADAASIKIAKERGSCDLAKRHGVHERFTMKIAVAPTSSISILCGGVSAGIEPWQSNGYVHKNKTKAETIKNKHLEIVLQNKAVELEKDGRWVAAQWKSIIAHEGSVQHLDFLDEYTKSVFKTAFEIDQRYIIEQASDRAMYIDQGQSTNIFLRHDTHKRDLLGLHIMAWDKGLKTLYYCRSTNPKRATVGGKVERKLIEEAPKYTECLSCQ
jgi:ribonucleoside-diphosphate reductase alpha chain